MHNVPFERSRLGVAGGVWFQTLTGCGGMEAGFPLPTLKFPRISGVAECAPMARYVAVLPCHVFIFQGLSDLSARTWIFVWRVPSDSRRTRRWTRRTAARVTFSADHEIAFSQGQTGRHAVIHFVPSPMAILYIDMLRWCLFVGDALQHRSRSNPNITSWRWFNQKT